MKLNPEMGTISFNDQEPIHETWKVEFCLSHVLAILLKFFIHLPSVKAPMPSDSVTRENVLYGTSLNLV